MPTKPQLLNIISSLKAIIGVSPHSAHDLLISAVKELQSFKKSSISNAKYLKGLRILITKIQNTFPSDAIPPSHKIIPRIDQLIRTIASLKSKISDLKHFNIIHRDTIEKDSAQAHININTLQQIQQALPGNPAGLYSQLPKAVATLVAINTNLKNNLTNNSSQLASACSDLAASAERTSTLQSQLNALESTNSLLTGEIIGLKYALNSRKAPQ